MYVGYFVQDYVLKKKCAIGCERKKMGKNKRVEMGGGEEGKRHEQNMVRKESIRQR